VKARKPIARSTKRIRPNAARKAREFVRCYESLERVEWIQRHPSVVSGRTPCVNAHVRGGGAGYKGASKWIVPLTDGEHDVFHQHGKSAFEEMHGIDLDKAAQTIEAECRQWNLNATVA
jgi:hypothetical protein